MLLATDRYPAASANVSPPECFVEGRREEQRCRRLSPGDNDEAAVHRSGSHERSDTSSDSDNHQGGATIDVSVVDGNLSLGESMKIREWFGWKWLQLIPHVKRSAQLFRNSAKLYWNGHEADPYSHLAAWSRAWA
jgi:hypothetical protein